MRSPPHLSRLPAYPVTGGIGIIATVVTILVAAGRWEMNRFVMSPAAFGKEPWRLVVSALPHVLDVGKLDVFHLPFNLYWLWLFGTKIEDVFGHVKTLLLFLMLAAGSAAAEYALFHGGIGLSGVTYGLFGMLWFLTPRDRRFTDTVDARTTRLMVGWFFFCIVCTFSKVWAVANVAHGVGALLGGLVGAAVAARTRGLRLVAGVAIPAVLASSWVGATTLRPRLNMAHDAQGSFQDGYQALQSGHPEDAIRHYRIAVSTDPRSASSWYNLGVAYDRTNRREEGVDAFRHAYDLDPHGARHRATYLDASRYTAAQAAERGEHDKAIRLLLAAAEVDPQSGLTWHLLEQSYEALGKHAEAADARERADRADRTAPRAP
ncbi:Hypothetical protein A7982_10523 [Minicystis rosea]|nr:Hypothetical protein A7982_10523 [Minicystis rosea]